MSRVNRNGWMLAISLLPAFARANSTGDTIPRPVPQAAHPYTAVLVWHDVVGHKTVWFDTLTSTFQHQIAEIHKEGFHIITLPQLLEHLTKGTSLPSRPLMLCFDDNNQGIFRNAFPVLEKYHYPFTLFVHTAYVGVTTSKKHNTWQQLKQMQNSGLALVQSLTASHPENIRLLDNARITRELNVSRHSIELHLGTPVYAFVYPCDVYSMRVANDVWKAGYKIAFTEDWGNAGVSPNMYEIHRYPAILRFQQCLQDVIRGRS